MTRRALFLIAFLLLATSALAQQSAFTRETHSLVVDGKTREYLVFTPVNVRGRLPVIFGLHGGFGTGEIFAETSRLHEAQGAEKFIFVYPNGYRRSWNAGICCGQAQGNNIDDVKFFGMMMDALARRPDVDGKQFFVTGFSNGAMMTYRLACELSERITAVAPVGAGSGKKFSECVPVRPVPLLHIHGTLDEWAPFKGGMSAREQAGVQPAIEEGIRFWAEKNGCGGTKVSDVRAGARCTVHEPCKAHAEVTLCTVEGMAHQWPGDEPSARSVRNFGAGAPQVKASDTILAFFSKYLER